MARENPTSGYTREVESLRLFDRLVAGNDHPVAVDDHRAAGTALAQRAGERVAAARCPQIRVQRVRREIGDARDARARSPVPWHLHLLTRWPLDRVPVVALSSDGSVTAGTVYISVRE